MDVLLINIPSRKITADFDLPLGLLYAGSIIERCGCKTKLLDLYLDSAGLNGLDSGNFTRIEELINNYKPSIIGYGGIATSYGRTKVLSNYIRRRHPEILQVAGGPLASVFDLLLRKTGVDVVFHGETEISLPVFLKKIAAKSGFDGVPGISYLKGKEIVTTPPPEQVSNLDSIPLPNFDLVNMNDYLLKIDDWLKASRVSYKFNPHYSDILHRIGNKKFYLPIVTSRGCTHKCLFCYRHMRGVRQHSVDYLIKYMKYLMSHHGAQGFHFGDELFNSSPQWVFNFCDAIEKEKLDIFYIVAGARVDKVNKEMLSRLKETGCVAIFYGQESGSDLILKEYKKGITRQQNQDITLLTTEKSGIFNAVQVVIGSPSENTDTVKETIGFLKNVNAYLYSANYLIPLPGTPVWEYVQKKNLIKDTEAYLNLVAEKGGMPLINLTGVPDKVWSNWGAMIRKELNLHFYRKTNLILYCIYGVLYILRDAIDPFTSEMVKKRVPVWMKSWSWSPKA